jgi:hypothetical protein
MGLGNCIFCDVRLEASQKCLPTSKTEEHVFAAWYRNSVVHKIIKMFTADGEAEPHLNRNPPLERLVNTSVCKLCNNGWMSQLEIDIAPIIKKLESGIEIGFLSRADIELLARWTGKTAAVLSHVTPQLQRVSRNASLSIHPGSGTAPKMRFFYSKISNQFTLEGGYLQIVYGAEIGLVGTKEPPGTRIIFCLSNHCLIVDFPPIVEGAVYDLSRSCSSMLWPTYQAAGLSQFVPAHPQVYLVLKEICRSIDVAFDTRVFGNG